MKQLDSNEFKNELKVDVNDCETVYERVIDVVTSAYGMRSENYYVKPHF